MKEGKSMFNMLEIGKRISNLRKENNLTQVELADQLGISYQAVSNWERGDSMPDISKLSDLAEIFKISIDELLGHSKQAEVIKTVLKHEDVHLSEMDKETIEDVMPLMKPSDIDEHVDLDQLSFDQLIMIAPFIDEEDLDQLVLENYKLENINELSGLAPFLSENVLSAIILKNIDEEDFKIENVMSLIPFIDEDVVDILASKGNLEELPMLAPFMSEEKIDSIVKKAISEGKLREVMGLMPFTKRGFFK